MEPVRYNFDESGEKGFLDPGFSASDYRTYCGYHPTRKIGTSIHPMSPVLMNSPNVFTGDWAKDSAIGCRQGQRSSSTP
jgi:hypothetical protein